MFRVGCFLFVLFWSVTLFPSCQGSTTGGIIFSTTGGGGSNTNTTTESFTGCGFVNATSALHFNVCITLVFDDNCEMDVVTFVDSVNLFEDSIALSSINQNIKTDLDGNNYYETCREALFPTCSVCTRWSNIIINETVISGCGSIETNCSLITTSFPSVKLGCFQNSDIIAHCFGGCLNHCSFNGECHDGECICTAGFGSPDCSQVVPVECNTNNDCGGSIRGTCENNECVCSSNFGGTNCGEYLVSQDSSPVPDNTYKYVIGFVIPFGALLFGVVGFFLWRRKKQQEMTFSHFSNPDDKMET